LPFNIGYQFIIVYEHIIFTTTLPCVRWRLYTHNNMTGKCWQAHCDQVTGDILPKKSQQRGMFISY